MEAMILAVPDVSCGHCVAAISSSVGEVPGVEQVEVDLDGKVVRVVGEADRGDVCAAIFDAGFDVVG